MDVSERVNSTRVRCKVSADFSMSLASTLHGSRGSRCCVAMATLCQETGLFLFLGAAILTNVLGCSDNQLAYHIGLPTGCSEHTIVVSILFSIIPI